MGLTLAVMEERVAKLEAENKSLLERWMAKIKVEADTMNEANEFLARVQGMRLSSPIRGPGSEPEEQNNVPV